MLTAFGDVFGQCCPALASETPKHRDLVYGGRMTRSPGSPSNAKSCDCPKFLLDPISFSLVVPRLARSRHALDHGSPFGSAVRQLAPRRMDIQTLNNSNAGKDMLFQEC
jgi:hypothetical protein